MRFRFSLLYSILILAVFGIFALEAKAAVSDDVLVQVIPSNPAPNENVDIILKSFVYNLDSVSISWSVNGKMVASSIGKKTFSTTAGKTGEGINVVATISLPNGTIDTKITIKSSVMILLWQANDSYVPPFYKGKALPSQESEVKVVAMPEIKSGSGIIPSQNLVYSWKKDYVNESNNSGYGKNYFLFVNDYLEDSNIISVTASTTDQTNSSNADINIGTSQPKILFYRNDSNLGTIWEKTLDDTHKIKDKEVVSAIPYFISPKEILNPTLVWSWFINDTGVNLTGFNKNSMPLQTQAGVHGTSKLRLDIANSDKVFQTASKEISIEF